GFTHPLRTWVEIVGTTGVIRIPNMWIPDEDAEFHIIRQNSDFGQSVEIVTTPGQNQMVHMLDDFAAAVWENREAEPNPEQAILTQKVLDALALSARDQREITV
ncbi:MAG: Gfo/Idh/MocA family oxidoreductase, partial [Gemmataceae bacterium]